MCFLVVSCSLEDDRHDRFVCDSLACLSHSPISLGPTPLYPLIQPHPICCDLWGRALFQVLLDRDQSTGIPLFNGQELVKSLEHCVRGPLRTIGLCQLQRSPCFMLLLSHHPLPVCQRVRGEPKTRPPCTYQSLSGQNLKASGTRADCFVCRSTRRGSLQQPRIDFEPWLKQSLPQSRRVA